MVYVILGKTYIVIGIFGIELVIVMLSGK